jgi:hypothetical protein
VARVKKKIIYLGHKLEIFHLKEEGTVLMRLIVNEFIISISILREIISFIQFGMRRLMTSGNNILCVQPKRSLA